VHRPHALMLRTGIIFFDVIGLKGSTSLLGAVSAFNLVLLRLSNQARAIYIGSFSIEVGKKKLITFFFQCKLGGETVTGVLFFVLT